MAARDPARAPPEAAADLDEYGRKRDFAITPEPPPGVAPARAAGPPTFMVHKHHARRLHYDLRLEIGGALASWAIPRGPSLDPREKRLAVETEDHPYSYGSFEGRIPEGEYGAGDSHIWDRGVFETLPPGRAAAMRKKGHMDLLLMGEKLKGRWHLVRTRGTADQPEWLFMKAEDEYASRDVDLIATRPESVVSGRRLTRGPAPAALHARPGEPAALLAKIGPGPAVVNVPAMAPAPDDVPRVFEPYTSGPRARAAMAGRKAAIRGEAGEDLGARHPALVRALAALPATQALLEGEVSDESPPRFIAHDALWIDGVDLRDQPPGDRRDLLRGLLPAPTAALAIARPLPTELRTALQAAATAGYTCVIGKAAGTTVQWVAWPAAAR
jgi:bifunctional non-homologous end joining protein LigD